MQTRNVFILFFRIIVMVIAMIIFFPVGLVLFIYWFWPFGRKEEKVYTHDGPDATLAEHWEFLQQTGGLDIDFNQWLQWRRTVHPMGQYLTDRHVLLQGDIVKEYTYEDWIKGHYKPENFPNHPKLEVPVPNVTDQEALDLTIRYMKGHKELAEACEMFENALVTDPEHFKWTWSQMWRNNPFTICTVECMQKGIEPSDAYTSNWIAQKQREGRFLEV